MGGGTFAANADVAFAQWRGYLKTFQVASESLGMVGLLKRVGSSRLIKKGDFQVAPSAWRLPENTLRYGEDCLSEWQVSAS